MTRLIVIGLTTAAALAMACGDDDGAAIDAGPDDVDARAVELGAPCPLADKVGQFEIVHRELYGAVTGKVSDGVVPAEVLTPAGSEAGCTLLRKTNPFCDPPCQPGQTCSQAMACVPFPEPLSAGTVTVSGLLQDVVIEPNIGNSYQDTAVPNPPFEVGADIFLDAAGDTIEAFSLSGRGVEPIVASADSWTIVDGDPLDIAWTPSDGPGRIWVTFNVDQHGNSPVTMFCDLEDTGSAAIPAQLLSDLIALGLSGVATANISRRTVDSVDIAEGCVELEVLSHVQVPLDVDGFTPMPP